MPDLPSLELAWDTLRVTMLPSFLAAAAVCIFVAILARGRVVVVHAAAALALSAGLLVGNTFHAWSLLPLWPGPAAWHWLALGVLGAQAVGWLALLPALPAWFGWTLRGATAAAAAGLLVPAALHDEYAWLPAWFAAVVLADWIVQDRLAQPSGGVSALGLALALLGAALVLIHAHTARFMDIALIVAASLAGIAVVAWRRPARGAVPGAVVALAGLLLSGHYETFSEVPWPAFLLPALAPLAPAVALLPSLRERRGVGVLHLLLVLVPVTVAVVLAARAEPLTFE
jgi:hypothetical protein